MAWAAKGEEEATKATKRGFWKDATPVPPWEWRRIKEPKQ